MYLSTLSEWLAYIGSIHSTEMDLGLERVKSVALRLNVLSPSCPVIIVGGTNGKGSTVAGLESIYRAAQYRTGVFTSPFLFKYNEQVKINGEMANDQELCAAFEKVQAARKKISLTSFEFCTLAAFVLFQTQPLDVWILEVGLGGRLDAVNILDADISVITSIDIDHVQWLGETREKIGYEKAGIFREKKPVVCGDEHPPETLLQTAQTLESPFYQRGQDFNFEEKSTTWSFINEICCYHDLPRNNLATQNMSVVLKVITLLQEKLPVTRSAIDQGLKNIFLPGRIQINPGLITQIYDVSHNPAAVAFLKKQLTQLPCSGKTIAVFSMLEDKDIFSTITAIQEKIDFWCIAPLRTKRKASRELLESSFKRARVTKDLEFFASINDAYREALNRAKPGDRIIVFGSFHTVAEVQENREK